MSHSMRSSSPAVGIDLGTTYSVVACLDASGRPETLVNTEGDRLTPSVVLFDVEEVVVGKEALKAVVTEGEHVAMCAKRDVGQPVYHKAIAGKQYPPEVLEAWILNKLRRDATVQLGPFRQAVVTVPAYFDEVRRKATQDAGYMAALEVIDIINEPTAAAVAYGYQKGLLAKRTTDKRPLRLLVYDLGGGTFDVTVVEVRQRELIALATDGDVQLGGYDWDQRLVALAAEELAGQHGIDPREDSTTVGRLWFQCEEAKRMLSGRDKATIAHDHHGRITRIELTRSRFEEATADLVDRTRFTVSQTLAAAKLQWNQIDHLLLVGGSTRMPMIRNMLRELSGQEPDASVAADEAVAHGAALYAAQLLGHGSNDVGRFTIRNVNSHSLGVVGMDRITRQPRNGIVIPRNTPIPVTARRVFHTQKENQKSILVKVVEGESASADACTPIGQCRVAPLPAGLPARSPVEVRFHYKPNGRLRVRVQLPNTSTTNDAVFNRASGLAQEHLDGWRRFISEQETGPRA
ncbi:MAG: Hsp70 family protein [Pirellulales bacterium]|nr:Hsp70 family protein [Pirellulales bacterium]